VDGSPESTSGEATLSENCGVGLGVENNEKWLGEAKNREMA